MMACSTEKDLCYDKFTELVTYIYPQIEKGTVVIKILLLGGYGMTGKVLARHILAQTNASLIIAGRNFDKAKTFSDELGSPRVTPTKVDASDQASLRSALTEVTLCLVASPTTSFTDVVARTCLDAGVDYLDIQFAPSKLMHLRALEPEILKAGRCFITEAGYHPGLPSVLVRYAATLMDNLEGAPIAGYLNVGKIPYTESVDELVEAFKDYDTRIYKDGAWKKSGNYGMRKFDFGSGIGKKLCYAMFFEELHTLPDMFPSLKETGFYIASTNLLADTFITPFVMLGLKLFPEHGARPLGKLIWWSMTALTKPPYQVVLMIQAKGHRNGVSKKVCVRIGHSDGYELTAIPVVALLKQYIDGSARRPGLWMMGHLAEPVRLIDDMQALGATIDTVVE